MDNQSVLKIACQSENFAGSITGVVTVAAA
jgi:hypothetical protein